MTRVPVPAKINLALLVGGRRRDGLHEVATVLQRIDICDRVELEEAGSFTVEGFAGDTLVRTALARLADTAGVEPGWRVRITKRIPVAAGLGGGSADAAAALALANQTLAPPLPREQVAALAAELGADVPFFLEPGPKLAEGIGERLSALELPQDFWIVIVLPRGVQKASTGEIYRRFDEGGGDSPFAERREALRAAVAGCRRPRDFTMFPPNDLGEAAGRSHLLDVLLSAGAFRADVSGAGPALYGLFNHRRDAVAAARRCAHGARVWVTVPVW